MKLFEKVKEVLAMDGFWNEKAILSHKALYNVLFGGRSNGKSTRVRELALEDAWINKRYFALIFRKEKKVKEIKDYFIDAVFRETDGKKFVEELTEGKADDIAVKAGEIFFTKEGKKVETCGYVLFLEKEGDYKSNTYPSVYTIIFEEFITKDSYLPGETVRLDSLISTVFRLRTDVKVWLIGNTINRVNPYVRDWNLYGMHKQKPGTIDLYTKEFYDPYTGQIKEIKIAVEYTKDRPTQSLALSKKGQDAAKGRWEAEERPKMSREELKTCIKQHDFVVTYAGFYFLLQLYMHSKTNDYFLYCERKTTPIQEGTRVIGDIVSMNYLYTKSFIPLVERERYVFNLIKEGKIFFCDDITGADFESAYKSLQLLKF